MVDKINKYLISADWIIVLVIFNMVLTFFLYSNLKEKVSDETKQSIQRIAVCEYKISDIEDIVFVNGVYEKVKQQARKEMGIV